MFRNEKKKKMKEQKKKINAPKLRVREQKKS